MAGTELATAWIRLVPTLGDGSSSGGLTKQLTNELVPATGAAGAAGKKAGARFGSRFKKMLGAGAIAAGVVGAFKGLYKVGSTLDDVSDTIRTTTGQSGAALEELSSVARDVGTSVPVDFSAAGDAVAALNQATGISGDALKGLSASVLDASRMMGEDGASNADAFGKAMLQWQVPADEGEDHLDALFAATQKYGGSLSGTIDQLNTYGSTLLNAGFSMDESASLFGQLEAAGLSVSRVMPGLNSAFRNWASEGKDSRAEFEKTVEAMKNTTSSTEALNIATDAFGAEGAQRLTTAVRSGNLELDDLAGALGDTSGAIAGTSEDTMDFSDKWKMTMNTAEDAIEPLATAIFDGLGTAMDAIMPVVKTVGEWVGEHKPVLVALAAVVGTVLVAAIVALTGVIWSMTVAMLASPITWIILAIVALVAAVVLLFTHWDEVVGWLTDVWDGFIGWISDLLSGFADWWSGLWDGIVSFFSDLWQGIIDWFTDLFTGYVDWLMGIGKSIADWWSGLWGGIKDFFTDLWAAIVTYVQNRFKAIFSFLLGIGKKISDWWNGLWGGIKDFFSGVWDGIVNAVKKFGGFFKDAFSGIKNFVKGAFNGVLNVVKGPINGLIGLINNAIDGLNSLSVTIPDWVPFVGGQTWGLSIPHIPMLASGGTITASGSVIVGEDGPEVLRLPRGASVDPDIAGAGGAGMQVSGPLVQLDRLVADRPDRVEEVAQKLQERIDRAARSRGVVAL